MPSKSLDDLNDALAHDNVKAFLRAIRLGEGTTDPDGYRRIVGGQLFTDFSWHPKVRVWIERYKVWSTAAGAYQITIKTWSGLVNQYGFKDFMPKTQDLAAVALIVEKGALDDIMEGRIRAAIRLCSPLWASLPNSEAGQRRESLEAVLAEYQKHGGDIQA